MNDTNALLIGLMQSTNGVGALVKLRKYNGELIEVADHVGRDPWEVLASVLQDVKPIKAASCVIFANVDMENRMDHKRGPTTWKRKGKVWFLEFDEMEMNEWERVNATKYVVLRQLFAYQWRWVRVTPDKLQSTQRLIDESNSR